MPNRRKGAPGSFGAPLDELLPRLEGESGLKLEVRRSSAGDRRLNNVASRDQCRIFLLNQKLYDSAIK